MAQGVPSHIGSPTLYPEGDPYLDFLPPWRTEGLRAVVFVKQGSRKGTKRSGQEYQKPLLVLPGHQYEAMSFDQVYQEICRLLAVGKPRLRSMSYSPDGMLYTFSDGSQRVVKRPRTSPRKTGLEGSGS